MSSRCKEIKEQVRLAAPLALIQVGYHLVGFVDTAMAGRISDLALGATGLGASIFFAGSVFAMGVVMGLDPIVSQAFGAGRPRLARRALWQGVWAGALLTVPVSLVIVLVAHSLERFGIGFELASGVRAYLYARLPSLFPFLVTVAIRSYLQAAHITRPIGAAVLLLNGLNFAADWLLIHGGPLLAQAGLPALPPASVSMVSLTTTLATLGQVAVLILAVRVVEPGAGFEPLGTIVRPVLKRVLGLGGPLGLQFLAEVGVFTLVGMLMGRMGARAMAAHQVALQFASMTFSVAVGIGAATSVQVGRAIGSREPTRARRAGLFGIVLGVCFMSLSALAMWLAPAVLIRLMTTDSAVVAPATRLLHIAGVFQIADGMQAVATGALRGAAVTRWTMTANLIAHWTVGLPVGLALAFGAGLGPSGLWWGLTAGLAAVAFALCAKFVVLSGRPIAAVAMD